MADEQGSQKGHGSKKRTAEDYDLADLPGDYIMPYTLTWIPNQLECGPPPTTQRQFSYLRDRLHNPKAIVIELPSLETRRLWTNEETATYLANLARQLHKAHHAEHVYLHHKTGCGEEAMVAALMWALAEPTKVPQSADAWRKWRETNAYFWLWDDHLEDSLDILAQGVAQLGPSKASKSVMTRWLKRKETK